MIVFRYGMKEVIQEFWGMTVEEVEYYNGLPDEFKHGIVGVFSEEDMDDPRNQYIFDCFTGVDGTIINVNDPDIGLLTFIEIQWEGATGCICRLAKLEDGSYIVI